MCGKRNEFAINVGRRRIIHFGKVIFRFKHRIFSMERKPFNDSRSKLFIDRKKIMMFEDVQVKHFRRSLCKK